MTCNLKCNWRMRRKELTHVTARAAAHFPMVPPPPPCHGGTPTQPAQVTQVPITLTQHDIAAAPCDTIHPMWRHRGTARPEPPPPPPWLGKLQTISLLIPTMLSPIINIK